VAFTVRRRTDSFRGEHVLSLGLEGRMNYRPEHCRASAVQLLRKDQRPRCPRGSGVAVGSGGTVLAGLAVAVAVGLGPTPPMLIKPLSSSGANELRSTSI